MEIFFTSTELQHLATYSTITPKIKNVIAMKDNGQQHIILKKCNVCCSMLHTYSALPLRGSFIRLHQGKVHVSRFATKCCLKRK